MKNNLDEFVTSLELGIVFEEKDGKFIYTLKDSNEYGGLYVKLDKNSKLTLKDDFDTLFETNVSWTAQNGSESYFMVRLNGDLKNKEYTLTIWEN